MPSQPPTKKSLGQHWLHDDQVLYEIVRGAQVTPADTVLEIGPGLGTLTKLLTKSAAKVIAVELDEKLASSLYKTVNASNLQALNEDILAFDFSSLPADFKIVANIPYYITGKLLRLLSETANPPKTAVLLVQKEVAERVTAVPDKMSILSVTTQYYWQVELGRLVPAALFTPPPKVDSQIIILNRRASPLFGDIEAQSFFMLVKIGFAQPRKTLLNNLSAGLRMSRDEAQSICELASLDSRRRPQTLSLQEWHQLYNALHS